MRRFSLLIFVMFFTFSIDAQTKSQAEKYASVISETALKKHLLIVAGAEMEGRETATRGERKAAAYLINQLQKIGLQPAGTKGYKMPFPVFRDSVIRSQLTVNDMSYEWNKDYGYYAGVNHSTEIGFSEAVFAGYGISSAKYDNYKNLDVAGKLVVVLDGEPIKDNIYLATGTEKPSNQGFPYQKALQATKHGAAGLLIIQKHFPMQFYNTVLGGISPFKYNSDNPVNTFFISEKVATDVFKEKFPLLNSLIGSDGLVEMEPFISNIFLSYHVKKLKIESNNILAILEGSDKKDEYVFITAHYDHIGKKGTIINYGADDDGSGTVAILQIAEAFMKAKADGHGPRRSIVFMLVSGEEKGLWGSEYYSDYPIYPLDKTSVDLNIDMIGRTDLIYLKNPDSTNYVYIIGNDKLSSDLLNISESNNQETKLKLDYRYNDLNDSNRFYYRSDHYNFARKGVPIIFYFDGVNEDYHKPSDTVDKINFDLYTRRSKLVFYTAWEIANMDRMLKRDKPLK